MFAREDDRPDIYSNPNSGVNRTKFALDDLLENTSVLTLLVLIFVFTAVVVLAFAVMFIYNLFCLRGKELDKELLLKANNRQHQNPHLANAQSKSTLSNSALRLASALNNSASSHALLPQVESSTLGATPPMHSPPTGEAFNFMSSTFMDYEEDAAGGGAHFDPSRSAFHSHADRHISQDENKWQRTFSNLLGDTDDPTRTMSCLHSLSNVRITQLLTNHLTNKQLDGDLARLSTALQHRSVLQKVFPALFRSKSRRSTNSEGRQANDGTTNEASTTVGRSTDTVTNTIVPNIAPRRVLPPRGGALRSRSVPTVSQSLRLSDASELHLNPDASMLGPSIELASMRESVSMANEEEEDVVLMEKSAEAMPVLQVAPPLPPIGTTATSSGNVERPPQKPRARPERAAPVVSQQRLDVIQAHLRAGVTPRSDDRSGDQSGLACPGQDEVVGCGASGVLMPQQSISDPRYGAGLPTDYAEVVQPTNSAWADQDE